SSSSARLLALPSLPPASATTSSAGVSSLSAARSSTTVPAWPPCGLAVLHRLDLVPGVCRDARFPVVPQEDRQLAERPNPRHGGRNPAYCTIVLVVHGYSSPFLACQILARLTRVPPGIIGVHPIFGAFLAGLICPHDAGFAVNLTEKIEDLISVLFL